MNRFVFVLLSGALASCTSVQVKKIDPAMRIGHICIQNNPKVIVGDFLPVVRNGFSRYGITTEVYESEKPPHCVFHMTYTALKNWDVAMYMYHAELDLYRKNEQVAFAEYRLRGKGGLALNKWASVESKMTPVIDELLKGYKPGMAESFRKQSPYVPIAEPSSSTKIERLSELKALYDKGLITESEYSDEKQRVLRD